MNERGLPHFYSKLKKEHHPWRGQIELTYRCSLNCVHCYCKGSEDRGQKTEDRRQRTEVKELATSEWKKILDEIYKEGCLYLTFSGGDPLIREDFLEIYGYAKSKGFLIELFTNGQIFNKEIIDYFVKSPPASIELTLNGITENTYESITQITGSFKQVMAVIEELAKKNLPLVLKCNCLKQNKNEIAKIKVFSKKLLGEDKKRFKFDPMLYPRLNGDLGPCNYRLSPQELLELRGSDPEIWDEYERSLKVDFPDLNRLRDFLYRCNAWMTQFFINPYGKLKFCQFSEDFSVDLRQVPFKEGFYKVFPQLLNEKFKTNSKCQDCNLRAVCYHCPARAYLETGDREAPVEYFCELAKVTAEEMRVAGNR